MNEDHQHDYTSNLTEVESVCMSCLENGVTRFLPMKIPYFRDVIVSSFECPHCGNRNNELMNSATISENGIKLELCVKDEKDLKRQLVVSDYCSLAVPSLDFSIDPPGSSGGYLTTVEGVLGRWKEGFQAMLKCDELKTQHEKLEMLINKLDAFLELSETFTLILDDPSGGSFVERYELEDSSVTQVDYKRNAEQQAALGIIADASPTEDIDPSLISFNEVCPACSKPCEARMHPIDIPHFKEVIIMATCCEHCGYKSSEVRTGGPIEPLGRKIILKVESLEDMSRDVLKSSSCSVFIPEIDLHLGTGTLGGRFTTLEGLLDEVKDELINKVPFCLGDSADASRKEKLNSIVASLDDIMGGKRQCTVILDDPLGRSYLQSLYAPDPDPQITEEEYERSFEQNEEFGLNDAVFDNY